jgi:hypothetical protein
MKLIIIFKRLVLINFFITLFFVFSSFLIPDSEKVRYFNESVDVDDSLLILGVLWIIALFITSYLLYTFKKIGKRMFLYVFLTGLILAILYGPIAFDPLFYFLDGVTMSISGALLLMLYFTPISKKF